MAIRSSRNFTQAQLFVVLICTKSSVAILFSCAVTYLSFILSLVKGSTARLNSAQLPVVTCLWYRSRLQWAALLCRNEHGGGKWSSQDKNPYKSFKYGWSLQDILTLRWFGSAVTSLWWRHPWFRSSMRKMAHVPWSCPKLVPAAATFTHAKPQTTKEKLVAQQNLSFKSKQSTD